MRQELEGTTLTLVPMRRFQADISRASDPKVQLLPTFSMCFRVIFRLRRFPDRVSVENSKARCHILEQDGITVPALHAPHARSLSCQNTPPNFCPLEASFSSYSRKTDFDTTLYVREVLTVGYGHLEIELRFIEVRPFDRRPYFSIGI